MALSSDKNRLFAAALCTIFAIALQIQISLFATENYAGLRVNLADLFLPIAGIMILTSLLLKKTAWPKWQKPFSVWWLVTLTALITFSLLNGYRLSGELSRWALINKFTGWFVLMAYLHAGAWITANYSSMISNFARPFILSFLLIGILSAASIILSGYGIIPEKIEQYIIPPYFQLEGLMGNRNAFAFILSVVAIFTTIFSARHPDVIPKWILIAFWASFPALICLNGSRTLWLSIMPILTCLVILNKTIAGRFIFLPLLLGAIVFISVLHESQRNLIFVPFDSSSRLYRHTFNDPDHATKRPEIHCGDNIRLKIIKSSLERWKQNPVLGAGLGGGMVYQQEKYGEFIDIIDNSMLWILTDMGLAGLVVFLSCFGVMLAALWPYIQRKKIAEPKERHTFLLCTFLMLLVFGLFSLVHEILYTRFLWFILGLALAAPKDQSSVPHQTQYRSP